MANVSYLVFVLEKLKSSFPIDMSREDANKEEKLFERLIEKFRQMTRQVSKSKREITDHVRRWGVCQPAKLRPPQILRGRFSRF